MQAPPRLLPLAKILAARWRSVIAAVVVLAVLPPSIERATTHWSSTRCFVLIALAQAWNILAGYGGLVSLAPAVSVGVGAYTAAVIGGHLGWPLPLLILGGGLVAAHLRGNLERADVPLPRPLLRHRHAGARAGRLRLHGQLERPRRHHRPLPHRVHLADPDAVPLRPGAGDHLDGRHLGRAAHPPRTQPARPARRRGHGAGDGRLHVPHQAVGVGALVVPHRHGRRPRGPAPERGHARRRARHHLDHQHRHHHHRRRHRHDRRPRHRRRVHRLARGEPRRLPGAARAHHRPHRHPDHPLRAVRHLGRDQAGRHEVRLQEEGADRVGDEAQIELDRPSRRRPRRPRPRSWRTR